MAYLHPSFVRDVAPQISPSVKKNAIQFNLYKMKSML